MVIFAHIRENIPERGLTMPHDPMCDDCGKTLSADGGKTFKMPCGALVCGDCASRHEDGCDVCQRGDGELEAEDEEEE